MAPSARSIGWIICRARKSAAHFEKHFTARRMAQDYLSVYRSLADRLAPHLRLVTDDAPAL